MAVDPRALDLFELTFAGMPFRIPSEKVCEAVEGRFRLDPTLPPPEPYEWNGLLPPVPPIPQAKLFHLFYPWGARRWSRFTGIMHVDDLTPAMAQLYDQDGAKGKLSKKGTFRMHVGDYANRIETQMFMLPPQPLLGVDGGTDLYLITLVDERYFWRWAPVDLRSVIDPSFRKWEHTWTEMFTTLQGAAGVTITVDGSPIPSIYGQPDGESPFYSFQQSVAPLLDAACAHVGRVLVRKMDGTYVATTYATATTAAETARTALRHKVGGLSFTKAQASETVAANSTLMPAMNRPQTVNVTTGDWDFTAGTDKVEDINIPREDRTDFLAATTINVSGSATIKGFLKGNYVGSIRERGTKPPDGIETQLASDFYDWNARNLSESFDSISVFDPAAGLDAEYAYFPEAKTNVWFDAFNYDWRDFWHWDGTVINAWPRTAILSCGTPDPTTGLTSANIIYKTDANQTVGEGGEWPAVYLGTTSGSAPRNSGLWPFRYAMTVEALYAYTEYDIPTKTVGRTFYQARGIFQEWAQQPSAAHGNLWGGEQYMGPGTKHMGALSLYKWGWQGEPIPNWMYHGLVPFDYYSNQTTISSGGLAVVGGRSTGLAEFAAGHSPLQSLVASSLVVATGMSGGVGGAPALDDFGAGFSTMGGGLLIQGVAFGPGGPRPDVTSGPGAAGSLINGPFLPGGGGQFGGRGGGPFTPYIPYGIQADNIGGGLCSAGYVASGGGFRAPLLGFGYGQGLGAQYNQGWAVGRSGFFGGVPVGPAPGNGAFPMGTYPPADNGPAMFVDGLFVGGGGIITQAVQGMASLSSALNSLTSGKLVSGGGGTLASVAGTRTTAGNVENQIGANRWVGFGLGSH